MSRRIARVLLDSPLPQLDRLFDYAIPDELGDVVPGVRVRVPLRSAGRMVDAYVVECDEEEDSSRALSEVDTLVSKVTVLPPHLYRLARRVADRAAGSASDIIRLVIPKRQVRVEKSWQPVTSAASLDAESVERAEELIAGYGDLDAILAAHGRGAVEATPVLAGGAPGWAALLAALAVRMLGSGESTVLIVPDHRDLDAVLAALDVLAPDERIVRIDSRQSNPERYRAFLRTLEDTACIVVGNRSAVYAPIRAGLVVVWDDGDSLLSEPLAPYVHARDAALIRQEEEGSGLLFVSHTRSSDVERLVLHGWLTDIRATRRVLPKVLLSTPQELEQSGRRMPSSAFLAARSASEEGPVLVQVARPGFAPSLVCGKCRAPARCTHCGGPLGARRRGALPHCGWCGRTAHDWRCTACSSTEFRLASAGTERTAEEFGRAFPGVRIIVADGAHPVERVEARPSLVIATRGAEPAADGGYRAVILLDGARMLQAPDLRIGESCLRWWANAAVHAADGAPVYLVGVEGAVGRAFATWNHAGYARAELAARAPLRMPPLVRFAVVEGTREAVGQALGDLDDIGISGESVLGPVPLPDEDGRVRALVRFDYAQGAQVATTLRAAVIAAAVKRRSRRGASRIPLSVRLDILDPEL